MSFSFVPQNCSWPELLLFFPLSCVYIWHYSFHRSNYGFLWPTGRQTHLFLRQDELLWEEKIRADWAAKGRDCTRWGYWHPWQSQPIPWAVEQRQEWKSPQTISSRRLGEVQTFSINKEVHGCLREVSTVLLYEPSSCIDRPWVLTPEVFGMELLRPFFR